MGAWRLWQPRLEEFNLEERPFGVSVPGEVEHVRLSARALRDSDNCLVLTHCPNASNIDNRTAVLPEVANCVPTLMSFVTKCFSARSAGVLCRMYSKETRTIACSSGVQQEGPMGPVLLCLALRSGLKRFREEFEGEGVKASANVDIYISEL